MSNNSSNTCIIKNKSIASLNEGYKLIIRGVIIMKNKQLITTCLVGVVCTLAAIIGTTAYYSNKEKEETPVVAEA